ncbi:aldo/keto reductase [Siansivirga zeaxanthinifaciens]|uniref:Aldo/keto reductase n=1 Tax=Siansivirga zeaxanthinifaciens CC-SAMT-1 TaxID=1454006 RepID=A0A0C5WNB7_9FLAO|nr:aldo/keto reductase [Siansivirga zeaxanthinifaciens]AJR04375.1 aldo/keto reductase [Siansivirga zeaxanthinifaciens CC-SAMT-1]
MNYRKLGLEGFEVSEVGLGCWQLGADWGQDISKETAFNILSEAEKNGITFFDTADVYGNGKSEIIIGEFLKTCKTPIRVATKFGRAGNAYPDKYTKTVLRQTVLESMERLGVASIDLLQLHCIPTPYLKDGAIFNWLRELKAEGLIKHFGASVETVEEGLICIEQEGLLSLQVIFNVFRQKLITELFPKAEAKGVGIIVRLPLASGLLTGKFTKETTFAEDDHRNFNRNGECFNVGETFAGLPFKKGLEFVETIKNNVLPSHLNMVQLALRWLLDHKAVSTIIPGASSVNQVISNASVSNLDALSEETHTALRDLYKSQIHQEIRGGY